LSMVKAASSSRHMRAMRLRRRYQCCGSAGQGYRRWRSETARTGATGRRVRQPG
jgi:hypothetical protein